MQATAQHENFLVVLFGSPGAGKGAIGKLLKEEIPRIKAFGMGDLFRELAVSNPDIQAHLRQGRNLSDDVVLEVFEQNVRPPYPDIVLADGWPRSIRQARELLGKFIAEEYLLLTLCIDIPEEVARDRMLKGRQREDDTSEAHDNRFSDYNASKESILNFLYKHSVRFNRIDNGGDFARTEEQFGQILYEWRSARFLKGLFGRELEEQAA